MLVLFDIEFIKYIVFIMCFIEFRNIVVLVIMDKVLIGFIVFIGNIGVIIDICNIKYKVVD